jgi:hypothetical protein
MAPGFYIKDEEMFNAWKLQMKELKKTYKD